MTYLTGEVTVVHDWTQIDFTNFAYSAFRFNGNEGGAGFFIIINGAPVTKIVGVTTNSVINPNTTVVDEDLVLLGNPKSVFPSTFSGMGGYRNKYSMLFEKSLDQYMDVGDSFVASPLNLINAVTISAWLKPVGVIIPTRSEHAVDRGAGASGTITRGYALVRDSDHAADAWGLWLGLDLGPEFITSATPVETDRWCHVVGTWDDITSVATLYVNGVLEGTTTVAGASLRATTASSTMVFGGRTPGPTDEFNGNINQVSVWNKSFTQEEVTTLFNVGKPSNLNQHPLKENGVSWWPMGVNTTWNGGVPVGLWTAQDLWGGQNAISGSDPAEDMVFTNRVYGDTPFN